MEKYFLIDSYGLIVNVERQLGTRPLLTGTRRVLTYGGKKCLTFSSFSCLYFTFKVKRENLLQYRPEVVCLMSSKIVVHILYSFSGLNSGKSYNANLHS